MYTVVVLVTMRNTELAGVAGHRVFYFFPPSVLEMCFLKNLACFVARALRFHALRYCAHLSDTRPYKSDTHLV